MRTSEEGCPTLTADYPHIKQYQTVGLRHDGDVAWRTKIEASLTPEARWARTRNSVIRHPRRRVLLFALWCVSLCISVWQTVLATSLSDAIWSLVNAAMAAIAIWYLWRVRRDAHLDDPPSFFFPPSWLPGVPPRS